MKIKRRQTLSLVALALSGNAMPSIAGVANPRGPEGRPVTDRTIRFVGKSHEANVRVAYPAPDDMVDRTANGEYDVDLTYPSVLYLGFEYNGFFWQGRFGKVGFRIELVRRQPDTPVWKDMDALLAWVRADALSRNARSGDRVWNEPTVSLLNGVPSIRLDADYIKGHPKDVRRFYFPFEEDFALEITVDLVDNSNRPGLTKSNWRPRAEDFREKLLSTIKVSVSPKGSKARSPN